MPPGSGNAALFPALVALAPQVSRFLGHDLPGERREQVVELHADAHRHRLAMDDLAEAVAEFPGQSNRMKSSLGKWPGLFARIALTFHLIELADNGNAADTCATILSKTTAARAAGFMRTVLLPHLLRADALMFRTSQMSHAHWIAGFILARGEDRITARDVVRAYGPLRPPECRRELQEVMYSLVTVGWLREEVEANPIRYTAAWKVNPALHARFAERARAERERRGGVKEKVAESAEQRRQARSG